MDVNKGGKSIFLLYSCNMFINPNLYPALITAIILFSAGVVSGRKTRDKRKLFTVLPVLFLFCIPGLLFILYYTRIIGEPMWYIEFRSIRGIEILSGNWGLLLGFLAGRILSVSGIKDKNREKHESKSASQIKDPPASNAEELPIKQGTGFDRKMTVMGLCLVIAVILVLIPFIKPIILPVKPFVHFQDRWRNGVCLQSGGSTCGPASLATLLSLYGTRKSEEEIARNVYSSASGTENWYMIRYARNLGFKVTCFYEKDYEKAQFPSIIGTSLGKIGHFVVLMDRRADVYVIGDSLIGRMELSREKLNRRYKFEGFVFCLTK